MNGPECAVGASNKARIDGLEDGMSALRQDFGALRKTIEAALKRPGWLATTIIAILSSACIGLIVALASRGGP